MSETTSGPGIADRLDRMAEALNRTPHLLRLGRLFSETVLVEVDGDEVYLQFHRGRIEAVVRGPSRKISWAFGFRTDREALDAFWRPIPAPGFHDLFGLVKLGRGRVEGDILALVKNLRFFKEFMALGREGALS